MSFKNNRNSREDKSGRNRGSSSNFGSENKRTHKGPKASEKREGFSSSSPWKKDSSSKRDDNNTFGKKADIGDKKFDASNADRPRFKRTDNDRRPLPSQPWKKDTNWKKDNNSTFGRKADAGNKKFDAPNADRPRFKSTDNDKRSSFSRPWNQKSERSHLRRDEDERSEQRGLGRADIKGQRKPHKGASSMQAKDDGLIRLNRYIANAGICSRRKADDLISAGVVTVNDIVVTELGTKVDPAKDEIKYNGERLKREKMMYILLNKPKDYITTTDDPQERKTVMMLVEKASKERIYPIGRLDRNTTGLLLLTNDGSLADQLSHPRNKISKIYNVELDKSLSQGDFNKIEYGLELEDGIIKPDDISYILGASKREVGLQIHSGKNRIVRRIFEHLGYEVKKLDRTVYGTLTKKDLPRGKWRHLTEKEVAELRKLRTK